MEYYFIIRKKETLPFAITWIDLEGIMLSEINQREKILCVLIYTWNLKKPNSQKLRVEWWLPGAAGGWRDTGHREQTSN